MLPASCFDANQLRPLSLEDTVPVDGSMWTVREMVVHGDSDYALYPVEELWGYIAFWLQEDGTFPGVRDDRVPVIWVGEKKVKAPLTENLILYSYSAGKPESNGDYYVPYNTTGVFEEGELVAVYHSDDPEGPQEN